MKEKEMNQYETTDLALAAFLVESRYAIFVDIGKNDKRKKTFVFNPGPPTHAILGFYDGSAKVSAKRLIEAYENLNKATYVFESDSG
ncbi:MAG: DUF5659 domain-containing protein [Candidatus Zixiibacteriota bacterium]